MSAIHHKEPFPRSVLWFVAVVISFTMISAAAVRLGYAKITASPMALRQAEHLVPMASRDLSFIDRKDGALTITDVSNGRVIKVIEPGVPSGFIRGVLRGMGRERRMHNVGPTAPFRLMAWPDGELSITDLSVGRSIELTAFGPTNREAFAELLK